MPASRQAERGQEPGWAWVRSNAWIFIPHMRLEPTNGRSDRGARVRFVFGRGKCYARYRFDPDEMIVHLLNTRDILDRDDDGLALAIVGYDAPKLGDAVLDDHVDARRPGLLVEHGKDVIADLRIAGRNARWDVAGEACQGVHQIGAADDADHPAASHHRQTFHVAALHELDHFLERVVLRHGDRIGGHDLVDFSPRGMDIFVGEAARPDDEFQPFRPAALRAELAAAQEIAFGHDAYQFTVFVDHRQPADAVLQHQPRGFKDGFVRPDRNHVARHDIFNLHGSISSVLTGVGHDRRLGCRFSAVHATQCIAVAYNDATRRRQFDRRRVLHGGQRPRYGFDRETEIIGDVLP